jgi:hypothetical protein
VNEHIEKTPTGVRVFDETGYGVAAFAYPKNHSAAGRFGIRMLEQGPVRGGFLLDTEQRDAVVAALDPEAAKAKTMIGYLKQRLREADPTDVDGADVEDWLQEWEKML